VVELCDQPRFSGFMALLAQGGILVLVRLLQDGAEASMLVGAAGTAFMADIQASKHKNSQLAT
jgi:hypothetical protein